MTKRHPKKQRKHLPAAQNRRLTPPQKAVLLADHVFSFRIAGSVRLCDALSGFQTAAITSGCRQPAALRCILTRKLFHSLWITSQKYGASRRICGAGWRIYFFLRTKLSTKACTSCAQTNILCGLRQKIHAFMYKRGCFRP